MKTKTLTLFIFALCIFTLFSSNATATAKKSSANLRVKSVKIVNEPNEPMVVGEKIKLLASVKPAKARYKKIIWTSEQQKSCHHIQKRNATRQKKGFCYHYCFRKRNYKKNFL